MIKEKSFALLKSMSTKCEYFNLTKLKRMLKQDSEYEAKSERENEVSEKIFKRRTKYKFIKSQED